MLTSPKRLSIASSTLKESRMRRVDPVADGSGAEAVIDLIDGVVLVRSWGRNGTDGQELRQWFPCEADAAAKFEGLRVRKIRRGYS